MASVATRVHFILKDQETLSVVPHPHHTLQADLIDVGAQSAANDEPKFILTAIDALTGSAMASPLKSECESGAST